MLHLSIVEKRESSSRPKHEKLQTHRPNHAVTVIKNGHAYYIVSEIPHPRHLVQTVSSFAYTLFLFTLSDLKTMLFPTIIFALLNAPVLSPDLSATVSWIFRRTVQTTLWCWIQLLIFCLQNQRLPAAVREDKANKPWRPLPSNRLSPQSVSYILLAVYPLAYLVSAKTGGLQECLVITVLNYLYNDAGGADRSFVTRHLLNACGVVCYVAGALEIAVGTTAHNGAEEFIRQPVVTQWLSIIGLVIFSTIQVADLRDRVGDELQQRQTLPVMLGDYKSRWTVVVPVAAWSFLCPRFWHVGIVGHASVLVLGLYIGARTLTKRKVEEDRSTYKIWSIWLILIYALPLIKRMGL